MPRPDRPRHGKLPPHSKAEEYIAERLTQYRAGEWVGPNSALMTAAVGELTDVEIADLAAFISANFQ